MRLMEFLTPEEWAQFEQLIFDGAWKALATYQQQRASQRLQQMKPIAQLKPKATARNGQLARKAKRASHAAPPKRGCAGFCVNGQSPRGMSPIVRQHNDYQETRSPRRTAVWPAGRLQET